MTRCETARTIPPGSGWDRRHLPGARLKSALWWCVCCLFTGGLALHAAQLNLTLLVRTNEVATGSGAGPGIPDGVFSYTPPNIVPDWQIAAPVAASGGHFAFQAAVLQRDANGVPGGIDTGIWGGVAGGGLTTLFRQRLAAPPLGSNFNHYGLHNISEVGPVAFCAATLAPTPSGGLWWGDSSTGPVAPLELVQRLDIAGTTLGNTRPLQLFFRAIGP